MGDQPNKRFSDRVEPELEVDEKVKIDDVIGLDIEVIGFQKRTGSNGDYLVIQARKPGAKTTIGFTCGGSVVVRKIIEAQEANDLPLVGAITRQQGKEGKYFDIN